MVVGEREEWQMRCHSLAFMVCIFGGHKPEKEIKVAIVRLTFVCPHTTPILQKQRKKCPQQRGSPLQVNLIYCP
jgi:hypothetical protein